MSKMFYIKVNGKEIPVSEEIYREWKHFENKEVYADRRSILNHVSWEDDKDRKNDATEKLTIEYRSAEDEVIEKEEREEREQLISLMKAKIKELKPMDAYIVEKVFLEGRTGTEVAAELGIAQQTVSYRLKSILKQLRKMLSDK